MTGLIDPSEYRIVSVTHGLGSGNEHLAEDCPGGDAWPCAPLDGHITWEEFQTELAELPAWLSRQPRSRRAWLAAVGQWARGDR